MGKFLVVLIFGLSSMLAALVGLLVAVHGLLGEYSPDLPGGVQAVVAARALGRLFLLVLPVAVLIAAAVLALASSARSAKEAQTRVVPLAVVITVGAVISFFPSVRLTWLTAMIPVTNVSLVAREVIAGELDVPLFLAVLGSLSVLAAFSLWLCVRSFNREDTLFRG